VTVTRNMPPNAGSNGTLSICGNAAPMNLFAQLGGSPQAGGTWTAPGGAAHGTQYDPVVDAPGVYTYTVSGAAPCGNASATVTVTETATMTWYQDSDGDGAGDPAVTQSTCVQPAGFVSNANDQCPADPTKVAPGQCGCGVADTDTDGDGLANCVDPCPGGLNPGAACNDGNAGTINDVIGPDCICAGTVVAIDCEGTPGGSALPGTACDDGNSNTINDQWDAGCICAGTVVAIDCLGTPGGSALPGTACDDGNASTGNDLYQSDCTCAGEAIDCLGTPGGSALPGTACDDGSKHGQRPVSKRLHLRR